MNFYYFISNIEYREVDIDTFIPFGRGVVNRQVSITQLPHARQA